MAARTRKLRHDDETRAKIQTSQLVNRLTDHVLGEVELSATQVTAALGLLRKTLPDLAAVEHSGEVDVQNVVLLPQRAASADAWQREFAPIAPPQRAEPDFRLPAPER